MFKIFKKDQIKSNDEASILLKIGSLLIHAARIDENYTIDEKNIIKKTLIELGANKETIDQLILSSEISEKNSNQILDFTREIKNMNEKNKIKIIKSLWRIIYSNKDADMYETNLMRRLSGLLYIDSKTMGNIKEQVKKEIL